MNSSQNIPKLRFPEFQGMPAWEAKKLGEIAKIIMGQSPNSESYTNNPDDYVLVQGNTDLKNGWVQPRVWTTSITKKANKGSLIFTVRAPVGEVGKTNYEVVLGRGVASISGNEFIYQYLIRLKIQDFWVKLSSGSTFASINSDTLKNTIINIPFLPEQQKIADCLSSLDDRISAENDKLIQLQDHKKGLLQKLFPSEGQDCPTYRFPEFQGMPAWEEKKLIDVVDKNIKWSFIGGPFGSNLKASDYVENGVRVIQLQNIGDGKFNENYEMYTSIKKADELLANNIYPNEIILSKMGDPVGRACLVPNKHERYVMCSDGIRVVVDERKYNKFFVFSLINSENFRSAVEAKSTGSTRKRIGLSHLKKIIFLIPKSIKEQQKIADCLASLDELIAAQSEKIALLKEHKKGLMQQLFV